MIFAVAGSQLRFPRLMSALDLIAPQIGMPVFAQSADPGFKPRNIAHRPFITPSEFELRMEAAHIVVAHAGIGVMLSATSHEKPLIVMPRRASLNEHRNEHQLATAERFEHLPGFRVVHDEQELLESILAPLPPMGQQSNPMYDRMIKAIGAEIAWS